MKPLLYFLFSLFLCLYACMPSNTEEQTNTKTKRIFKGLYSYGPEIRTFTDCNNNFNYWVIDSAKTLELSYTQFNFEKPYEPVYIEAEGFLTALDTTNSESDFDSTLVVTKLNVISKTIPEGPCSIY